MKKFFTLLPVFFLLISSCVTQRQFYNPLSQVQSVFQKEEVLRVGFDLDDTLLFSTPSFKKAFESNVEKFSPEFWKIVNSSDPELSKIKKSTFKILREYQEQDAEIFIITSRKPYGAEPLLKFIEENFGIPREHVFFTHEKAEKLSELGIDIFYGDSDSDISAALEAGCKPVRVLRSPESSYKSNYNPGIYGEEILENSDK